MAKYTHLETRPIVTLDYGQGPYSYYAASGDRTLGSDGSLFFEHMALTPLSRMSAQDHPVSPEAPATAESGLTPAQNQALKLIAGKARHIERQRFNNARRIQEVQEQAQADLNTVTHDFTLNVLGGVHEGLTYDQITEHLESLKLEGFEDAVQYAVDGDLDLAYPEVEG